MDWAIGALVLIIVGAALSRILRPSPQSTVRSKALAPLGADRGSIYQPIAMEIETQAAILGISLNDAFEERDSGHYEIAWRLVDLSAGEWDRLEEILTDLLRTVTSHMPSAHEVVPTRSMVANRFKSGAMIDYVRLHEVLDQLVFGSRLRFQLHVRVLRKAAETLTTEFHRTFGQAERAGECPEELWKRFDLYFHDFDLVAKEALLAFHAFLLFLPDSALADIAADLDRVVTHRVRSTPLTVDQ